MFSAAFRSGGHSDGSDSGNRDDEYDFWQDIKEKIEDAKLGETVKVNARNFDQMPKKVMDTLRKSEDITLIINWNGGEIITIHFSQALWIHYPIPASSTRIPKKYGR